MRIGIGLPTTIAGAGAGLVVPWARAAEAAGFPTLGAHDRLAYDCVEPLTALAAAASVTDRARLAALVVIAPLRNPAVLDKQVHSLESLAPGRCVIGLGLGPRRDDYELAGVPYSARGRELEHRLEALRPVSDGGPELVLGGASQAALTRVVRWADGLVHQGGPPRAFRSVADRMRIAWSAAERPGRPRLWGMGYFALGPGAAERGQEELRSYYGFAGAAAARIVAGLLTSQELIREFAGGYEEAGCDELVLFPSIAEISQVDRLSQVLHGDFG